MSIEILLYYNVTPQLTLFCLDLLIYVRDECRKHIRSDIYGVTCEFAAKSF